MIPVSGLDDVSLAWVEITGQGFSLYGFMLYTDCDSHLVSYMKTGLAEIDRLSGERCAIFVIESPSAKWIKMAENRQHPWWKLFGRKLSKEMASQQGGDKATSISIVESLLALSSICKVELQDGSYATLEHLINPTYSVPYDRNEVWSVAQHFGIRYNQVPCLIFFKSLDDRRVKIVDLGDLENELDATRYFRMFFSSDEFARLI